MINITITCAVDEDFLEMATRASIPTKQALEEVLFRQFSSLENIVVKYNTREYNPKFGDSKICKCGHEYCRHFDSWEDMSACGCKYCRCDDFKEA